MFLEKQLKLKDCVYWDKNDNPYCPVCKTPLKFDSISQNETEYHCPKCNISIFSEKIYNKNNSN